MKRCPKCRKHKQWADFYTNRRNRDGLSRECKECCKKAANARSQANGKDYRHSGYLRRQYGLRIADVMRIIRDQNGVCAICGRSNYHGRRLDVDHDAETGRVRGMLCGKCNRGMGNFDHDPDRLRAAAQYLETDVDLRTIRPLFHA